MARLWREALLLIVVTAALSAGVKSFVVETFRIPSGSMEDTLLVGDRVLVNKFVYRTRSIDRGDVVVFSGAGSWGPVPPSRNADHFVAAYRDAMQALGLESDGTDYVKRVIGLPGDHVACCDVQGRITVNGVPLREGSYLYPGEPPSADSFNVVVPLGRLWVMGDHRGDSADSRYHSTDPGDGTIPESAVVGRVFLVIWPPSQVRSLPIPATFASRAMVSRPGADDPGRHGGRGYAAAGLGLAPCPRTTALSSALGSDSMNDDWATGDQALTNAQGDSSPVGDGNRGGADARTAEGRARWLAGWWFRARARNRGRLRGLGRTRASSPARRRRAGRAFPGGLNCRSWWCSRSC